MKKRCHWAEQDPLMQAYHDEEWGRPVHEDRLLFEFLILEGAQAGLSWRTILYRREGYRKAFHYFDAQRMSVMTAKDQARLMKDPGIIRNRLKIKSAIENAKAYLKIKKEFESFDNYIWQFAGEGSSAPRVTSPQSDAMSKDLKKRGFNFVGSTICYAYMQAVGLVDDHMQNCFRKKRRPA